MFTIKHFDGKDTETIALMPTMDDAIEWVRAAFIDPFVSKY